jgi:RHS repeat-associated protein
VKVGFQGQLQDDEVKGEGNHYTTEFRDFDPRLGIWWSTDPMAHERVEWTPYNFCRNNPILNTDPTGALDGDPSTDVTKNSDGSYTVAGGKADGDRNIYVVDDKGKRTGEVLGKSLTEYSFLDDKGNGVKGAVINPSDKSGVNFLNNEIVNSNLDLLTYMPNAVGGEKYDFKTRDAEDRPIDMSSTEYSYRGMPFEGVDKFGNQDGKTTTFASGRDFGNVAAGFVAGNNGLSWSMARAGFDLLESYQNKSLSTEGKPTQRAEWLGHLVGIKLSNNRSVERTLNQSRIILPNGSKW